MTNEIPLITNPLFLVGAERSGTTLLRLMLDHHPEIAWCRESEYMVDFINDNLEFPELSSFYEFLEDEFKFRERDYSIDRSLTYPQLLNSFLYQTAVATQKPIVGATVHRHFNRLLAIWERPRFIHIIRDGRDVAPSCIGMGWAGNVWTGIERWIEAEKLWQQLSLTLSPDQYITIKYESLICDPVEVLTKVCHFIGVAYDEKMLSYSEDTTYTKPNPRLIQQWRRKLSEKEIRLIEFRIRDMLLERGYELSGLPSLELSQIQPKQLRLQDWWERVLFRVNRYGLFLFTLDYLSRLLKITPLQNKVKERIQTIAKTYRK